MPITIEGSAERVHRTASRARDKRAGGRGQGFLYGISLPQPCGPRLRPRTSHDAQRIPDGMCMSTGATRRCLRSLAAKQLAPWKRRIELADFFLFLATRNSMSSRWYPWEIGYADGAKPIDTILVIPTSSGGRNPTAMSTSTCIVELTLRRMGTSQFGRHQWLPGCDMAAKPVSQHNASIAWLSFARALIRSHRWMN